MKSNVGQKLAVSEGSYLSKDQLESILTNVADGITVQDTTGKIVYANIAAARLTGFSSAEEMLAASPVNYVKKFKMFDEKGKPFSLTNLPGRRAMAGEKNPSAVIRYINTETGDERWSVVKAAAIYDSAGKPNLVVNVVSDLTERKEFENRKDDFISMASHELKTPLTSMNIFAQVLKKHLEKNKDEKGLSLYKKINRQLSNLTELVRELLDVTNLEKGKLQLKNEKFLVRELAEEITESMQNISQHTIELDWHTKHPVIADKERLRQVLVNLVTNAIKYSPQNTKIKIGSKKDDNKIIISVTDKGIGIAEEDLKNLFKRFYQVGEEQSRTYPGLGLGLYISQQIVHMHGGDMWVESKVGKGSTFYFSLPIATS